MEGDNHDDGGDGGNDDFVDDNDDDDDDDDNDEDDNDGDDGTFLMEGCFAREECTEVRSEGGGMTSGGGSGIRMMGTYDDSVCDLGLMNFGGMNGGSCIGACDGLRGAKPVELNEPMLFSDTSCPSSSSSSSTKNSGDSFPLNIGDSAPLNNFEAFWGPVGGADI